MSGRLRMRAVAIAAALFVAPTLTGGTVAGQESGRFRVLVPNLFPAEGANKNFGEDVAKELRKALSSLPTHTSIEEKEIKDALKQYNLKMEELTCTTTRQLGSQIRAQVALCATYTESGDQRSFQEITFVDLGSSQEFTVDVFSMHKDEKRQAAERIVEAFDTYVQQLRFRQFCLEYAQSSDWEGSLRNCDDGLELNPKDEVVMYQRAFTLWKMDRLEDAYAQLARLLEQSPYHDEGLQLGGFLATTLGDKEDGRRYYSRYLELNPGAVAVRRRIAYEMGVDAGDAEGAMLLIEQGLETEGDNPELLGDLGNYAFEAARRAMPQGAQVGDGQAVPPEVAALYRKAIEAYSKLYETQADSMGVGQLRNVILGHVQLGELDQAEQFARRILQTHDGEASLWSVYSTVLERKGDTQGAVQALQRIESIDPDYDNLYARQASLYLRVGQRDQALPIFRRAVERGQDPNIVARQIFSDAYQKGIDPQNASRDLAYGIAGLRAAKEYELNPETRAMMDFWHGYALYQQGMAAEKPQTLQSAQRSLPLFQQARQLFQAGSAYAATEPSINISNFLQATDQYIEIQEAIIRRGR
jgi:tetratricopeptide (TPR) repeat protein